MITQLQKTNASSTGDSQQQNNQQLIERRIQHKKTYISSLISDLTNQTIENIENMSDESVVQAFETITLNEATPTVLTEFISQVFQSNTNQVEVNLIDRGKPYYGPIKDYEATFSTGEVKELLNCQINTVKNRIKSFKLLGYRCHDKDEYRLPTWQFSNNSVIDGIDLVLHELNQNGIPALRKFTLPLMDYEDKCIIDVLRQGEVELALEMAATLKD